LSAKRDLLILGGGRFVTAGLGLATVRAVTTYLTPAEYGQFAILVVIQSFCGLFLINPLGMYLNRHTHEWWDDGTLLSRLKSYKWYIFSVSVIGCAVSIGMSKTNLLPQIIATGITVVVMVNAITWNSTWVPLLNMVGLRSQSVRWALVSSVFVLIFPISICLYLPTGLGWFVGQALGYSLGAFLARRSFLRILSVRSSESKDVDFDWKDVSAYCLPLALGTGFMWMQQSGYRLIVEHYWGLSALGYLSVGLMLAGQIWSLVESLAQQFLYPLFYKRIANSDEPLKGEAFSDLLNVLVPIYVILAGAVFLAGPYLLKVLVSSHYAGAGSFFRFGVGIEFCRVVANLLSNAAHVTKRTQTIVLPYAVGAIVSSILLLFTGALQKDIFFAAICLLIAATFVLIVMWVIMSRQIIVHIEQKMWGASFFLTCIFLISAFFLSVPGSWIEVFFVLISIAVISCLALYFFLKANRSLQRLIFIDLKNGVAQE